MLETKQELHCPGLNRDVIKYIAMVTMLLNHIGTIFMEQGTFWSELCKDIGYFTAITMCYFLVEGYGYTRSKKRYALRLLIFAGVSQLPYCLAFSTGRKLEWQGGNMICNLLICFVLIHIYRTWAPSQKKTAVICLLFLLSVNCDWSILAPFFVMLFMWAGNDRERLCRAYRYALISFAAFEFLNQMEIVPISTALLRTCGALVGPACSAFCILFLYNGRRANRGRKFSQWFFYLFYPLHLLLLGIVRLQFYCS